MKTVPVFVRNWVDSDRRAKFADQECDVKVFWRFNHFFNLGVHVDVVVCKLSIVEVLHHPRVDYDGFQTLFYHL